MTDAGWAERYVLKRRQVLNHLTDDEFTLAMLKAEHARSVRIVKKRMKHAQAALKTAGTHVDTSVIAYWDGQEDACANLLTALQRGRGGKG